VPVTEPVAATDATVYGVDDAVMTRSPFATLAFELAGSAAARRVPSPEASPWHAEISTKASARVQYVWILGRGAAITWFVEGMGEVRSPKGKG